MAANTSKKTSIPTAMEVAVWSDDQFAIARKHNFSGMMCAWISFMLLNCKASNGSIHKYTPAQIASFLGCDIITVYEMLRKINASGIASLKLKHLKVVGRLKYMAKQRLAEEEALVGDPHNLKTAMIHREGIELLIANKVPGSDWKLAIAMALNCHLRTGELHEKRPDRWKDFIGVKHETTVRRSLKRLNAIGFLETRTEYLVFGRIPFTAMARAYFEINERQRLMERQGMADKAKHFGAKAKRLLYEAYGIVLKATTPETAIKKFYGGLDPENRFTPKPGGTKPIEKVLPFASG